MSGPAHQLRVVPFTPDVLDLVRGFDYGSEPYQRELADWIERDSAGAIARGTRVWLYATGDDFIGYGSLGRTNWKYPDATSKRESIALVPALALALRREFWGQPPGAAWPDRYSGQILRHLLGEAAALPGPPPAVGLYVHPNNAAAVKLYERFGFARFHTAYTDTLTGATYHGYLRLLGAP